jgi:hypothetical protein
MRLLIESDREIAELHIVFSGPDSAKKTIVTGGSKEPLSIHSPQADSSREEPIPEFGKVERSLTSTESGEPITYDISGRDQKVDSEFAEFKV